MSTAPTTKQVTEKNRLELDACNTFLDPILAEEETKQLGCRNGRETDRYG